MKPIQVGDYVLATKYHGGDPGDHFCVGFVQSITPDRVRVADVDGNLFRASGFRRARRITPEAGTWLVERLKLIEQSQPRSVWSWLRQAWMEAQ